MEELTNLQHTGNIYALSDIHGDMNAFIISLRDCAKVITKNINLKFIDKEIDDNLMIDISKCDENYDETLGYTWCGNNSYIIICGDMIDPSRSNGCIKDDNSICGEYPQIEIKLLKFINSMNKQAVKNNGRIIKLLGNHELSSILEQQLSNIYKSDKNYYHDVERYNIFKVGEPGFELLFEDGCYILVKINNSIFVHGQLPKLNILEIENINKFMNDKINHNKELQKEWNDYLNNFTQTGLLWDREWASPYNIDDRYNNTKQEELCSQVKQDLQFFMGSDNINNLRVILGHCPQNSSSIKKLKNITMSFKISQDAFTKTYSNQTIHNGIIDSSNQDTIFGITMQCPIKDKLPDYYIYHIDISSSRGFDKDYYYENIASSESDNDFINNENKYLFSKTPQILWITECDEVMIIKSKMKNTRIHLPRPNYEKIIKSHTSLNISGPNYDNKYLLYNKHNMNLIYFKKYLLYKQKYMQLKKLK